MIKEDVLLLIFLLQTMTQQLDDMIESLGSILAEHIREQRRLCCSLPADKVRITWLSFVDRISERHFWRMFRMKLSVFDSLCKKISDTIGEDQFKWDASITDKQRSRPTSPLIPGEFNVAISL